MAEERLIGQVKWFDNNKNYCFILVKTEGDHKDKNVFVHQVNIRANGYRKLHKGEYVEFVYSANDNESTSDKHPFHATDVSGILGGQLMCDFERENENDGFHKVNGKKNFNNKRNFNNKPFDKNKYGSGYDRNNNRNNNRDNNRDNGGAAAE